MRFLHCIKDVLNYRNIFFVFIINHWRRHWGVVKIKALKNLSKSVEPVSPKVITRFDWNFFILKNILLAGEETRKKLQNYIF